MNRKGTPASAPSTLRARSRFGSLLGPLRHRAPRAQVLREWMLRAVRASAPALGLFMAADGKVLGDHLLAVLSRALQAYGVRPATVTLQEARALIARQPADDVQLYYDFGPDGTFWIGAFAGHARALMRAPDTPHPPREPLRRGEALAKTLRDHAHEIAPVLFRGLFASVVGRPPRVATTVLRRGPALAEGALLQSLADQPLDAIALTYRYVDGVRLRLQSHHPPLVYRPAQAPLLLDEDGAPLRPLPARNLLHPALLYQRLALDTDRDVQSLGQLGVVYHETTPARAQALLATSLCDAMAVEAVRAPRVGCPDVCVLRVDVVGAILERGLVFFLAGNGVVTCASPIPARFLVALVA